MAYRYYSPTPMLGYGFPEDSLRRAMAMGPAFIGCDAGTMDAGPAFLGGDKPLFSRRACKRDLRLLIVAARDAKVPLLVGSCGGSGSDYALDWTWEIVAEIAREDGIKARVALIRSEPPRDLLFEELRAGKIKPLFPAPYLDESSLRRARRVVAMIGPEPYARAVDEGADIVLAGRSSDASIFAALPVAAGLPAGPAWHAGKILECGAGATVRMDVYDGIICTLDQEGFTVEPANPDQACTPLSVAARSLYEAGDPYEIVEPGGAILTRSAQFLPVDARTVRVTGSGFDRRPYTLRLEGVEQLGYQSVTMGAVRDPLILEELDDWVEGARRSIEQKANQLFGDGVIQSRTLHPCAMVGGSSARCNSVKSDGLLLCGPSNLRLRLVMVGRKHLFEPTRASDDWCTLGRFEN